MFLEGEDRKQVGMWTWEPEDGKALGRGVACSYVLFSSVFKCGMRVWTGGGSSGGMIHCKPRSEINYFILLKEGK